MDKNIGRRCFGKLPKTSKTKDITGGLPRVAELFEAEDQRIVQLLQKMTV